MRKKQTFKKLILSVLIGLLFGTTSEAAYAMTKPHPTVTLSSSSFGKKTGLIDSAHKEIAFQAPSKPTSLLVLNPKGKKLEQIMLFSETPIGPTKPLILPTSPPSRSVERDLLSETTSPTTEDPSTTFPPIQTSPIPPPPAQSGGLNAEVLFTMANAHRAKLGLPPFEKDERSCSLAQARAPEISAEIAEGHMHSGMYGRNLPYWNTENIIQMNSEEAAFNWWLNDYIHRIAIEGKYKYSCVACSGNNCAQEFTNFDPK